MNLKEVPRKSKNLKCKNRIIKRIIYNKLFLISVITYFFMHNKFNGICLYKTDDGKIKRNRATSE